MRSFVATSAALLLAACGGAETPEEPAGDLELTVSTTDAANDETSSDAEPEAEPSLIAAAYQGVWDYEGGTCAPESDMRMEVSATDITYYESYGRVTGTRPDGDDLIVDLAMEGEGQEWNESQRLSILGTGTARRLHVTNGDTPKTLDEYPRKACS
jgi:hypothetical protein